MSAIGAILNFHDRPLEPGDLVSLWDLLESRGPDGGDIAFEGNSCGLCYRAFHTNRESRMEKQPHFSRDGRIIVGDLRIDNREELIPQLRELVGKEGSDITDIELAMAAHEKWGDKFPFYLIGEYALVLLNPRNRTIVLARDHVGAKPLYYYHSKKRLICSSTIPALLELDSIPLRINEQYIAGFLAFNPEEGLTAFQHIRAVKPGHIITVGFEGGFNETRFWALEPEREIRYRKDTDYEEAFVDLFREAVRAALRSDLPVVADLSGGLDSSSVVCMADRLVTTGQVQTSCLETISHVYDEASSCDERKYISYVEDHRGMRGHHICEDEFRVLSPVATPMSIGGPNPFYAFAEYHRRKRETINNIGARAVLSGKGGDQIMNSNPDPSPELADLIALRKPLELHRRLGMWSKVVKKPYLTLLFQSLLLSSVSQRIQLACKPKREVALPEWIDPEFARRVNFKKRKLPPLDVFGFPLPTGRDQSIGFLSVMQGVSASHDYASEGPNVSHPFLFRPLVEFMQAIPFSQKLRPGENRSLLRRSLRNVVPERILKRRGKKSPTEALVRGMNREWKSLQALLTQPRVCSHGFANREALSAALEQARLGHNLTSLEVINVVSIELWLRALEAHERRRHESLTMIPGKDSSRYRRHNQTIVSQRC